MNKNKKSEPKKILVRNTERPVPKTKLVIESNLKDKKKNVAQDGNEKKQAKSKFHSPELNSALGIANKIDKLVNTKAPKGSDLALSEKLTKKVNFPADQKIYKDLIPLQVSARTPSTLSARDPLPQKDREPVLSSYAIPSKTKEYAYMPSVKLETQSTKLSMNNLRLYQIIQMNSE